MCVWVFFVFLFLCTCYFLLHLLIIIIVLLVYWCCCWCFWWLLLLLFVCAELLSLFQSFEWIGITYLCPYGLLYLMPQSRWKHFGQQAVAVTPDWEHFWWQQGFCNWRWPHHTHHTGLCTQPHWVECRQSRLIAAAPNWYPCARCQRFGHHTPWRSSPFDADK